MKIILTVLTLNILINAVLATNILPKEWTLFKEKFSKVYEPSEDEKERMDAYLKNEKQINEHNDLYEQGEKSFKLAVNEHADMFPREIKETKCSHFNWPLEGCNFSEMDKAVPYKSLPSYVNWTEKGAVTPVKNQKDCGSCWAFAAVGALEGRHYIDTDELVNLSVQNIIDCTNDSDTKGCDSGNAIKALCYVATNEGIQTEKSYPYEAKVGECRYNSTAFDNSTALVKTKGFVLLPQGDEKSLEFAIANSGPVAVSMHANNFHFRFYRSGIFQLENCITDIESLDHAMLAVGYGTENGQDYWLVKNSWGEEWGEGGYIRVARNAGNNCGIATISILPA